LIPFSAKADAKTSVVYCRLGIFVGFASFFFMEKTLRVLSGDEEGGHSHSHSHSHQPPVQASATQVSGVEKSAQSGLKNRKEKKESNDEHNEVAAQQSGPSKLSAYLNLFGDFVHNM
jgi:solute carrier family 39 (zinc transporter), member 7